MCSPLELNSMSLNSDAERKTSQCLREVLKTLGKSGKQTGTHYLGENIDLKTANIPQKPELFHKRLNLIFEEQAADFLEIETVQNLQTSLCGSKIKTALAR